ncbi:lysophospholipid acyltransferase family protein [Pontiellaceae bacterium B12227]|nr:lysophospholipid acyltransferase family protein [Pontiellaceae bacterium B12227]
MSRLQDIRRAARRPIETFFFRLATVIIPLLPRTFMMGVTWIAGTSTFYFAKRERTTGMANLDVVFGDTKTDAEKRKILKSSLISFTRTMSDIFWFSMNTEKRAKKYQRFIPAEGPYFEEQAHIIITAHTGNWELIGLESGLLGIDVASVAAVTKNAAIDKLLNTLRQRTGQSIIPREGAMRTLIARFRKKGKAAFVLDQNTSESEGGIWINFLGMPTPVSSAPAHLAYRTGTDIIFAFSQPIGGGKYEAYTGQVITPPVYDKTRNQDKIVKELTQQIVDVISKQIRSHPESWLWSYKHWKQVAPGDDPARYPKYD